MFTSPFPRKMGAKRTIPIFTADVFVRKGKGTKNTLAS